MPMSGHYQNLPENPMYAALISITNGRWENRKKIIYQETGIYIRIFYMLQSSLQELISGDSELEESSARSGCCQVCHPPLSLDFPLHDPYQW